MDQGPDTALSSRRVAFLEEALSLGVSRGERAVALVRIVGAGLSLIAVFLNTDLDALLAPEPRPWISATGLAVGVVASSLDLRRLSRGVASWRSLQLSVSLDTAVIAVATLPVMLWPRSDYPGLFYLPSFYFFPFAVALAGLRLDSRLVHWSVVLNTACAALMLALDLQLHGPPALFQLSDSFVFLALAVASATLAYAIAGRTRRLAMDGAAAVLTAERARQALGVYVSEEVAERAMGEGALRPGGERRDVAVLFSDLRDFTAYADRLPPERLVREVNDYLDRMVEVIRAEGGVVDKYIGDAIMVVFGIPEARPDDAARAARTAAAMQRALEAHNLERTREGLPPLRQGIGVHYGPAIAGNIGSADRLQYTVMGSVVNVASRLENATKVEGVPVLLSAQLVAALGGAGEPALRPHGTLQLRGAEEPVEVFTLA